MHSCLICCEDVQQSTSQVTNISFVVEELQEVEERERSEPLPSPGSVSGFIWNNRQWQGYRHWAAGRTVQHGRSRKFLVGIPKNPTPHGSCFLGHLAIHYLMKKQEVEITQ